MKTIRLFGASLLLLAFLVGCDRATRLCWAPDGSRAAFIGADGLHLCDADGKLSDVLLENGEAAWLPDAKHLVVAHSVKVEKWAQLEEIISTARKQRLITQAEELRKQIMAYQGDMDKFIEDDNAKIFSKLFFTSEAEFNASMLYLWEHRTPELVAKLGEKTAKEMANNSPYIYFLELYDSAGLQIGPKTILYRSLDNIQALQP